MKRLILFCALAFAALSSRAVTLFPYFVDVAGDYQEGMPAELKDEDMEPMYSARPSFFTSLDEAKAFYADVLPFSTENIMVKDIQAEDGKRITAYFSPMLDDVMSAIFLVETPDKTFYICYDEQKMKLN